MVFANIKARGHVASPHKVAGAGAQPLLNSTPSAHPATQALWWPTMLTVKGCSFGSSLHCTE